MMIIVRLEHSPWCTANSSYMVLIITTAFCLYSFALTCTHLLKSLQFYEVGITVSIPYSGDWARQGQQFDVGSLELTQT